MALVTGGTSGLGLATAQLLIDEGASVVISGRSAERGQAALVRLGDRARLVLGDVAAPGCAQEMVRSSLAHFARLDLLVVNAGIGLKARLLDTPAERLRELLDVNVVAAVETVRAAAPHLAEGAAAVLIGSDAGVLGEPPTGAYSVSKAALIMAGKMLAADLAPAVRVNIVCPGDTPPGMRTMLAPGEAARDPEEYRSWPLPPRGRLGRALDTAKAIAYLLSDDADFVTGSVLLVDGGSRAAAPPRP